MSKQWTIVILLIFRTHQSLMLLFCYIYIFATTHIYIHIHCIYYFIFIIFIFRQQRTIFSFLYYTIFFCGGFRFKKFFLTILIIVENSNIHIEGQSIFL